MLFSKDFFEELLCMFEERFRLRVIPVASYSQAKLFRLVA